MCACVCCVCVCVHACVRACVCVCVCRAKSKSHLRAVPGGQNLVFLANVTGTLGKSFTWFSV